MSYIKMGNKEERNKEKLPAYEMLLRQNYYKIYTHFWHSNTHVLILPVCVYLQASCAQLAPRPPPSGSPSSEHDTV